MNYRPLQQAPWRLSEVGLGCASYWGKVHFSERQAINLVHQAMAAGINYFDTGHSYSGGEAERRLGKALKQAQQTGDWIISSKAGTRLGRLQRPYNDFDPQWIEQSCETSLRQLGVEQLSILFLHGPNPEDLTDELLLKLELMQQAGKFALLGVNAFADHVLDHCLQLPMFQVVMLDHNVYRPERRKMIRQMHAAGKDVFVAGALAGAIYAKDFWRFRGMRSLWYWLRAWKNNPQLRARIKHMQCLHQLPDWQATQLALAYVLNEQRVSTALIGSTRAAHLETLIQAVELRLDQQWIQRIESQARHIQSL